MFSEPFIQAEIDYRRDKMLAYRNAATLRQEARSASRRVRKPHRPYGRRPLQVRV